MGCSSSSTLLLLLLLLQLLVMERYDEAFAHRGIVALEELVEAQDAHIDYSYTTASVCFSLSRE